MTEKNKWYDRYKRRSKKKKGQKKDQGRSKRKYLVEPNKCVHLNRKFSGSSQHHINRNIIINIPIELHQSIIHSMKSGKGMAVINILSDEEIKEIYGF